MSKKKNDDVNVFLKKGANIVELENSTPNVANGFVINGNIIKYVGSPKALAFVIPTLTSVVCKLEKKLGFKIIRTPKTYLNKKNETKTTDVVTVEFANLELAEILVDNLNKVCDKRYQDYLKKKEEKEKEEEESK